MQKKYHLKFEMIFYKREEPIVVIYSTPLDLPSIKLRINKTIAIKNTTLANVAAPAAIQPNPKITATIATIKKVIDNLNIVRCFKDFNLIVQLFSHSHRPNKTSLS